MGAWIETFTMQKRYCIKMSHPTWVRGLKPYAGEIAAQLAIVAPYVGAWIETSPVPKAVSEVEVAPYVGAWIETFSYLKYML